MERYRILDYDNGEVEFESRLMVGSSSPSRSLPISTPPSDAAGVGLNGGHNYIIHPVGKYDTLAGVAIKYGVEVADIKRLNGLVTDLQMFALKTLKIPLPGKHPPSPTLCNGQETQRPSSSEQDPSNRQHSDLFDSFQSLKLCSSSEHKVSPAMNSLQGYYGLRQPDQKATSGDQNGKAKYLEDGSFYTPSKHPLSHQRKSRSVANNLMYANGGLHDPLLSPESEDGGTNKWIEKLLGRRQKSETELTSCPPEKLLKEESSSSSGISSGGLALRSKAATRAFSSGVDAESGGLNPIPLNLGESPQTDPVTGVRKSSSTSSLMDPDSSALLSLWPTSKWSLKPDFQALSSAAAAMPIFDGLPKPMSRKSKAALD
ncbi:uncharacterized protein LOC130993206 isoform X1 [Salvia miltiorrhiza]|uniref:uncharacterized protein LOC130993206 isoform X1 n=1 Tax=Salvia miltiorrhiza TaxID=226208 RepID=UPI0025ABAF70|nr:uncharacterized protein LOC130993206 isoform X1 [Salvia miltiorrhiza]